MDGWTVDGWMIVDWWKDILVDRWMVVRQKNGWMACDVNEWMWWIDG